MESSDKPGSFMSSRRLIAGAEISEAIPMKNHNLVSANQRYVLAEKECEVFGLKYSPDQTYLAASYADGTISVYNSAFGERKYTYKDPDQTHSHFPVSALCWKPN